MIQLIKAVVLDTFKYKESSHISHVYTQEHGIMSIIVSGIGKKNALHSQIYFQPLTIIQFVTQYKEKKGILRASETNLIYSPIGITPDVRKIAICFFISEVVLKTCKEKEQDQTLFELLEKTIMLFEDDLFQDLHLHFLVQYAELMGFSLGDLNFIKENAVFYNFNHKIQDTLIRLTHSASYLPLNLNRFERMVVVKFILHFFELNLGVSKLKSLKVLEDIFV